MTQNTIRCDNCDWEGKEVELIVHSSDYSVCPNCLCSGDLIDIEEKVEFKYLYNVKQFFTNLDQLSKDLEEKQKKKEISKIINSLQTPFTEVMNLLNQKKY